MQENEADRIAARRARREADAAAADMAATAAEAEGARQGKVQAIRAEIPVVLQLLAARNYPGVEQVHVGTRERLFRGPVPVLRGGWAIAEYSFGHRDSKLTGKVYLISTGEIHFAEWIGITPLTIENTPAGPQLDMILIGLRNKRRELGG